MHKDGAWPDGWEAYAARTPGVRFGEEHADVTAYVAGALLPVDAIIPTPCPWPRLSYAIDNEPVREVIVFLRRITSKSSPGQYVEVVWDPEHGERIRSSVPGGQVRAGDWELARELLALIADRSTATKPMNSGTYRSKAEWHNAVRDAHDKLRRENRKPRVVHLVWLLNTTKRTYYRNNQKWGKPNP